MIIRVNNLYVELCLRRVFSVLSLISAFCSVEKLTDAQVFTPEVLSAVAIQRIEMYDNASFRPSQIVWRKGHIYYLDCNNHIAGVAHETSPHILTTTASLGLFPRRILAVSYAQQIDRIALLAQEENPVSRFVFILLRPRLTPSSGRILYDDPDIVSPLLWPDGSFWHEGIPQCMAVSPDGKAFWLAVSANAGENPARLWRMVVKQKDGSQAIAVETVPFPSFTPALVASALQWWNAGLLLGGSLVPTREKSLGVCLLLLPWGGGEPRELASGMAKRYYLRGLADSSSGIALLLTDPAFTQTFVAVIPKVYPKVW